MVWGVDYLYDGIPLVVVGLGLFAVPEIVDLLRRDQSIAGDRKAGRGLVPGHPRRGDNWWLTLRCSGIGALIGAIPGLGGTVVDWIAYGHAVQTVKTNPRFGKGDIRGVIAPESANNAKEGGGLLPTLMFGIPGGGAMAVFLGGMVLLGIQPGPSMVGSNLNLTYQIVWSLALANVLGAGLCILLAVPDLAADADPVQAAGAVHDRGDLLCRLSGDADHRRSAGAAGDGGAGHLHAPLRLAAPGAADRLRAVDPGRDLSLSGGAVLRLGVPDPDRRDDHHRPDRGIGLAGPARPRVDSGPDDAAEGTRPRRPASPGTSPRGGRNCCSPP
jgi:hypothetical protein